MKYLRDPNGRRAFDFCLFHESRLWRYYKSFGGKKSKRQEREREREPPRSAEAAATPPIQEGSLDPGGRGRKGKPSGTALWQAASVGRELFGRVWFSEEEVGGFN